MTPVLDVVLGGSIRSALMALKNYNSSEPQDTIRLFSRSTCAPRHLETEEIVRVFDTIGTTANLLRLEIVGPPESNIKLEVPALAIAQCLLKSSSRCLKDLLLTRIRVTGSPSDMSQLSDAMRQHKSINRLFIADCHPKPRSSALIEFLKAAATNPQMKSLVVHDVPWVGQALCLLGHGSSQIKSLRVSGAQCLGPIEWMQFMDNLHFNGSLKELRITTCALCPGIGYTIGRLLATHQVLEEVVLELRAIDDTVPICCALLTNTTLTRLDLVVHAPGPIEKQQFITSMFTDTINHNYTLQNFALRSATSWLTCPRLEFYLRLNRCGNRGHLMQSERHVTANEWVDAVVKNRNDLSVLYYILLLNPSLCQNIQVRTVGKKSARTKTQRKRKRHTG